MNKNIKKIIIKAKKSVFSSQIGNNTSKLKGEGYDFVELREYEDGEDIRKIDWVISAKMQKPYVKVFNIQRELNIQIVPLLTGSIHFGTKIFKQDIVTQVAAILGYSTIKNGDSFSSFIVNEEISLLTKKTKKQAAVEPMCEYIYNYDCIGKKIDYNNLSNKLFNTIKPKSIIFLIGDFLNIDRLDLKLLSKKHQVMAIIVRDRFEENPRSLGTVNLKDPQTFKSVQIDMNNYLLNDYKNKIKKSDNKLFEDFKKCNVSFTKIYTDEEPFLKLIKLFR